MAIIFIMLLEIVDILLETSSEFMQFYPQILDRNIKSLFGLKIKLKPKD